MHRSYASILGPKLLSVLVACCATLNGQEKTAAEPLTDISILGPQSSAVVRIVNQGIMSPLSPGHFGPQELTTRRQFVVAVHRLFHAALLQKEPLFHDVPSTDPDFEAINSVARFMQRQAFCPGCALNNNFLPETPVSQTVQAVTLVSILNSRHQLELVHAADSASILAAADLPQVPTPARAFLATAVQNKIVTLDVLSVRAGKPGVVTRADTALLLDAIQQRYKIPNVPHP